MDYSVRNKAIQLDYDPNNKDLASELERLEQARLIQYDAMIESLSRLLLLFPEDTAILLHIGAAYYDSGRYEKSKQFYGKALELNPAHFDAKYGLDAATNALKQSGNPEPMQP